MSRADVGDDDTEEWEGRGPPTPDPGKIAELMAAYKAGTVSAAVTIAAAADLEAKQAPVATRPRPA